MNQERTYLLAMVAIAVLATIPQIPVNAQIWGAALVIIGIVGGVMLNYEDMLMRLVIYVLAVTLPVFSDSLDYVWVVGPWVNTLLDHFSTGLQGMAVGLLVMGLMQRIQTSPDTPQADS